MLGRLVVLVLAAGMFLILLEVGPFLLAAGVERLADSPAAGKPAGPPDCADASGAEIAKVLGRPLKPVVVSAGCAWGTRLDDPSTVLVTIRMSPGHASYERHFEASVKQRRVVYGTAYDASFDHATALWVATGQPIRKGASPVMARADTHVVVSRADLGVSDDRGRAMALAIALAANTSG